MYISPCPSWFILGAVSALGRVVFICFHFKKQNEMKKKIMKKTIRKLIRENEQDENKIKTKRK